MHLETFVAKQILQVATFQCVFSKVAMLLPKLGDGKLRSAYENHKVQEKIDYT